MRNRPVAVAAALSGRSLVLSVSREAQDEGVFKGMSLRQACMRCPGLTVLPPDPRAEEQACQILVRMAARYTPCYEPARPGHLYLDLTGTDRLWGPARDVASRFRREVRERLALVGTAGVAGNKMVADIASRTVRFEEVVDVEHGREAGFLAPLKVGLLPGIGPVRQKLLSEELNIGRIRQLAALDLERLALVFGRQARVIRERAMGIDPTPVFPLCRAPMVDERTVLPREEMDDTRLLGYLYRLVERCGRRMRKQGLIPRRAGLLMRYADHAETVGRVKLYRLSVQDDDLYAPLEHLFLKQCTRRIRVGFIRVWFYEFTRTDTQMSLFDVPNPDEDKKWMLTRALDHIRDRYGESAVIYGRCKASDPRPKGAGA
ncbi:MAG: DNA polymerase IV [Deltaproteobacteria bacterium]|nr:DNA polymerase IV [Deltaproteobacteria bacterium]